MVLFIFMRFHINIPGPGTARRGASDDAPRRRCIMDQLQNPIELLNNKYVGHAKATVRKRRPV